MKLKLVDVSLEQRMRAALGFFQQRSVSSELSRCEQAALT